VSDMKKLMDVLPLLLVVVLLFGTACQSNKKKDAESVNVTLFDKDLPEIKTLVNGEWELVSGKNAREFCEYENTFIKFADDQYVWTEDGKAEPRPTLPILCLSKETLLSCKTARKQDINILWLGTSLREAVN